MSQIKTLLQQLGGKEIKTFSAKVTAVDKDAQSISATRIDTGLEIEGIRLTPGGEATGFIVQYPKIGSFVLIAELASDVHYVCLAAEIESICLIATDELTIQSGTAFKLQLNKDGVIFNDGLNGGLINIINLVARLNALETRMATHQHLTLTGPTLPDPITNLALPGTTVPDIEDPKIKH
jgi:hypothetical protein